MPDLTECARKVHDQWPPQIRDKRVNFDKIKTLLDGTYAAFASSEVAERLAGTPVGTIPPFSFDDRLELLIEPELLQHAEIYFNAARPDRTIALATADYQSIAKPRVEPIDKRAGRGRSGTARSSA